MHFFRNFPTKQPFAWAHHSTNQACRTGRQAMQAHRGRLPSEQSWLCVHATLQGPLSGRCKNRWIQTIYDGKVDRWRTKLMYLICLGSLIYFPARIQSPTRQHQWRIRTASAFPIHSTRGIKITAYFPPKVTMLQTNLTSAPASWFSSPASLRRTWSIPTIRTTLPTHIWARSFSRARFTIYKHF